MKRYAIYQWVLALISVFIVASTAFSASITIAWDPVTSVPVSGYKIYYGTASHSYSANIVAGNVTTYTVSGLSDGAIYYFAVTAYDSLGNESPYSDELMVNIPKKDSDGDGLSDSDEINIYKTDPYKADTDGDGITDGEEIARGTNPLVPDNVAVFSPVSGIGSFGSTNTTVYLSSSFSKPVVILGPPTYKERDPGVMQISAVSASSFTARFKEWKYLNGVHAAEKASYFVLNEGRYLPSDGSVWEAGTFSLNGTGNWIRVQFSGKFPGVPKLFLTVQTENDPTPVIVRARNVDANGFEAALFHEEALAKVAHGAEIVGYLAVWAPNDSGNVANTPYVLGGAMVGSSWSSAGTFSLMLQEEKSADSETTHQLELVNILVFGPNVFAQNIWWLDTDPASLRLK